LTELWNDLAGLITTIIPEDMIVWHLGGGIQSMLVMLGVGIPKSDMGDGLHVEPSPTRAGSG